MITLARIQKAIDKAGIPLELVRGEGYQYFVYSQNGAFESVSVYVCYLKDLSIAEWVEEARGAHNKIQDWLAI